MNRASTPIGRRIRQLRQQLRLTQAALAREYGTSQSAISAIEVGDTQPGIDFLLWLADRGGISVEHLITGKEPERAAVDPPLSRDQLRTVVTEAIAQLTGERRDVATGVSEASSPYARPEAPLSELERRLLTALRRLDPERQERIVAFAEDLAGACRPQTEGE